MSEFAALKSHQSLPDSVKALLVEPLSGALEQALNNGLPANLVAFGEIPLFEYALAMIESTTRSANALSVPQAPVSLLDAFVGQGLFRDGHYDGQTTAVGMCLHYGQWDWARHLMAQGFPLETDEGSALLCLVDGRLQRAIRPEQEGREPPASEMGTNVHWLDHSVPAEPVEPEVEDGAPVWMSDTPAEQLVLENLVADLVAAGAKLEFREPDEEGRLLPPPLMRAILNNDLGCTVALAKAGADLTTRPPDLTGRPLEIAIAAGSKAIVGALLDAGAPMGEDPSLPPEQAIMNRPLVLAARRGLAHLIPILGEALPMEQRQVDGVVAMHFAASSGHVPVMRALRQLGIPYDARSLRGGYTPMHQAASGGHVDAISFLLRRGQKWDLTDEAGLTPEDVLRSKHPGLVAQFGLAPSSNVRMLFAGRSRPKR